MALAGSGATGAGEEGAKVQFLGPACQIGPIEQPGLNTEYAKDISRRAGVA